MKKLYINGRFLTQRITGVQRVAIEIVKAMDKIVKSGEVEILSPPGIINDIKLNNIKITIIGKKSNNFWVQWTFLRYVMKNKGNSLTISGLCPIIRPDFFVAHDVTLKRHPEAFTLKFRLIYDIGYKLTLKRCKHVFTVSEFSKEELMSIYGLERKSISVVYNATNWESGSHNSSSILEKYGLENSKYYLSVSSKSIHKNQQYIYELAHRYPNLKFIIVGGSVNQSLNCVSYDDMSNLIFTDYLCNEDLIEIYRNADGFIFPSLYEGFGIPPLEAIMLGVKHIALSDISVFREVYPKGVYYFDPKDVSKFDMNMFMNTTVSNDDFTFYKEKYSWDKSAEICLNEIKKYND